MLVQKLRLQRGWSQEQLATVSGLSVRTIQRIERGHSASLESMKALASVFEVDLSELKEVEMPVPAANSAEAAEALAFAHVRKVKRFYIHAVQYAVVISVLVCVNLYASPRHIWAIWPALGWGAGLLLHGLSTFDKLPFLDAEWERRAAERYLGRKL